MDEAKKWLQDNGVASLMDRGIKALIETKPADPALFLSQYYATVHEKEEKVKGVVEINATTLVVVMKGEGKEKTTVIDVRDSTKGGKIKGSIHIPSDQFQARLEEITSDSVETIVVASNKQGSDTRAAELLLSYLTETKHKNINVYTLSGRLQHWMSSYHTDPVLVEGFTAASWPMLNLRTAPRIASRRGSIPGLRIDVPEAPEKMTSASLAILMRDTSNLVVVDVRDATDGGTIAGSEHIPVATFQTDIDDLTAKWKNKSIIVIASHMSPDLDLTAATPLLAALHEAESTASVFILSEGIKGWVASYGTDENLVTGYTGSLTRRGSQGLDCLHERKRRSTGLDMKVEVPDAPPKLAAADLAAVILNTKQGSDGELPYIVVDVSIDPNTAGKGKIAGSVQICSDAVLANVSGFAEKHRFKDMIIVASTVSSDLDEAVAAPLQLAIHELGSKCSVFTLLGGVKTWIHENYTSPSLCENVDPTAWGISLPRGGSNNTKRHRPMHIAIPEAPSGVPPIELALLVKAQSESVIVVDVRMELAGGSISGSVHVPCDRILTDTDEVSQEWVNKDYVIFVSHQSPDLDLVAATAVMQSHRVKGGSAQVCGNL